MRIRPKSEEIFYNSLVTLIKNQLINDPNFETYWYERNNKMNYGLFKSKAEYILQEIENWKHLIIWDEK
jgi:hypothetical protein